MIQLRDGRVFLHCPKTGGTFFRRTLKRLHVEHEVIADTDTVDEHAGVARAIELFGKDVRTFFFVRHPATWLQSYWCDRMANGWGGDFRIAHDCRDEDFNGFVAKVIVMHPGFVSALYDTYHRPYKSTFYKFERLHESVQSITGGLVPNIYDNSSSEQLKDRAVYQPKVFRAVKASEWKAMKDFDYGEILQYATDNSHI